MPSITPNLAPRQYRECLLTEDGFIDKDSCYVPFWYTKTGQIVKWSLFLGLIVFICLYLIIGFLHAKKRIRENRPPLAYHRFLVPRSHLAQTDPRYAWPAAAPPAPYYQAGGPVGAYGMHNMAPPPVYDPNSARPPVYPGPPEGGSKVDPNQHGGEPSPSYYAAASAAPPPPQVNGVTGNNNPYRG
ncbi:hypothetical protein QBC39DRAFT_4735 [Podospora conica]|nr:hypothetical protein QBC39DRAFT_4735 [Schizothecium conicum]